METGSNVCHLSQANKTSSNNYHEFFLKIRQSHSFCIEKKHASFQKESLTFRVQCREWTIDYNLFCREETYFNTICKMSVRDKWILFGCKKMRIYQKMKKLIKNWTMTSKVKCISASVTRCFQSGFRSDFHDSKL